jgi:DNA-directed RNA polymerase subunit E'/Rpb7
MKITSPYKNIEQETSIIIEPSQMNSDIRNNMKINLKKKVEKKCNNNGYIDEVYRITEYSDGLMIPENLSGNVIYKVKYHCKICIPIVDTIIISQVKAIALEFIITNNGPLLNFIPRPNIDTTIWNVTENYIHKKNQTKLKVGDFVCIQILNKKINDGATEIRTICKLLEYATPEEVEEFMGNHINETSNYII